MTLLYNREEGSYRYIDGADPEIVKTMPSDVYTVLFRPDGIYFDKSFTDGDVLVNIDTTQSRQFRKEIKDFFDDNITKTLRESGITHRRGIILYGEPGSGKTSLVRSSLPYILSFNPIVLTDPEPGAMVDGIIPAIRDDDPDRPVVVIWDDFERIMRAKYALIQFMDGIRSPDHVLVICTTNNIDAIPTQLRNRPSRFGMIMEIPRLNFESRLTYVIDKYPRIAWNIDDARWLVDATLNDELDHLQEVCKLHLMGYSRDEILARIELAWRRKEDEKKPQRHQEVPVADEDDIFDDTGSAVIMN